MNGHREVMPYVGAGVAAALLGGFGLLADEVVEGDTLDFDNMILHALREPGNLKNPIGPPGLEDAVRDITALGSVAVLTILVVLIVLQLFLFGRARTAAYLTFAVLGGTAISTILKSIFDRPRPDLTGVVEVYNASFPSGHATVSAVVYLTLGALLAEMSSNRRLKVFYVAAAVGLTLMVGLSRIYLGVHYPTDVLAGWSLGAAWALICVVVAHFMKSRDTATAHDQ